MPAKEHTMLVIQSSLDVIDSCIWHSTSLKDLQPLLRRLLLGDVLDQPVNIGTMLHTITIRDETSICFPLRESESIGKHTK